MDELEVDLYYGAYTRSVKTQHHAGELRIFALGYIDHRTLVLKTDNRPTTAPCGRFWQDRNRDLRHRLRSRLQLGEGREVRFPALGVVQNWLLGKFGHNMPAAMGRRGDGKLPVAVLKPWFSAGYSYGSGDHNPNDSRHGTFFQVLTIAPAVCAFSSPSTT